MQVFDLITSHIDIEIEWLKIVNRILVGFEDGSELNEVRSTMCLGSLPFFRCFGETTHNQEHKQLRIVCCSFLEGLLHCLLVNLDRLEVVEGGWLGEGHHFQQCHSKGEHVSQSSWA